MEIDSERMTARAWREIFRIVANRGNSMPEIVNWLRSGWTVFENISRLMKNNKFPFVLKNESVY